MSDPADAGERNGVSASPLAQPSRAGDLPPVGGPRAGPDLVRRIAPGADGEVNLLTVPRSIALSGRIALCEKLIVEGTVESDLEGCRVLEVTGTGRFRGSVDVEIADIAGTLEGSVTASGVLTVRAGGVVGGTSPMENSWWSAGRRWLPGRALSNNGPPAGTSDEPNTA